MLFFAGKELQPEDKLTVSMRISISTRCKSLEQLIGEAASAMYEFKHNGRNYVTAYFEISERVFSNSYMRKIGKW